MFDDASQVRASDIHIRSRKRLDVENFVFALTVYWHCITEADNKMLLRWYCASIDVRVGYF